MENLTANAMVHSTEIPSCHKTPFVKKESPPHVTFQRKRSISLTNHFSSNKPATMSSPGDQKPPPTTTTTVVPELNLPRQDSDQERERKSRQIGAEKKRKKILFWVFGTHHRSGLEPA